ncbi:hypothetical protein CBER1_04516 [Cercospora berteroae]|uniref:Uncharacterized protein n=1 Tax=Cercospora berteroae TaxID=357750 RepID=A0A2S6CF31_9PEZI|nr:hypothetical protein CBER1_04516 [Cercospora berteroae]
MSSYDKIDMFIAMMRRQAPALENLTDDQIRVKANLPRDRGPIIVSGAVLHRHILEQIQSMRNIALAWPRISPDSPRATWPLPVLPDRFDDLLVHDARFTFSWRPDRREYVYDHLSIPRKTADIELAAGRPMAQFSGGLRVFFNGPRTRSMPTNIAMAVKENREDLDSEYEVRIHE